MTMATKRAKRLAEALEGMGWETGIGTRKSCPSCSEVSFAHKAKFCSSCGHKLKSKTEDTQVYEELEHAISVAIGESPRAA